VEGYSREALAKRAGVEAGYVERLLERGVLDDPGPDSGFSVGDVRRVRMLRGLEDGGLPLDAIATAVRRGDLSFGFLDLESWDWYGGFLSKTYGELSRETGIDLDLLRILREAMGFARPRADDPVHEEAMAWIPVFQVVLDAGVDPLSIESLVRVWGESIRRLAEASGTFYHSQIEVPLLRRGMSDSDVMQVANEAVAAGIPHIDRAIVAMYHAHSEHTWMSNVVEAVEATLEKTGLHHTVAEPPAMSFLDLTGYTRLTEQRGDEAAAAMASTLARLVQQSAQDHGGRAVKWLGDGVMLYFPDPAEAVRSALELAERVPAAGLPEAHTGIDAGPVVFQDGDYFGRTVNTAARIAARADGGNVLVSDDVVRSTRDGGIRFSDQGLVELDGLERPIRLYRAAAG
jgi:adenylate cyclase